MVAQHASTQRNDCKHVVTMAVTHARHASTRRNDRKHMFATAVTHTQNTSTHDRVHRTEHEHAVHKHTETTAHLHTPSTFKRVETKQVITGTFVGCVRVSAGR